jgi:2-polyprenyl-6-methoxyphenol hydroxylase-like FAD-dependent oxidoreductase
VSHTTCAIVGGGPAGMMLGLLLARAGVEVTVLEKHGDFLRDFRGDTVHPSTIRLLDELGLGNSFRILPQSRLAAVNIPTLDGSRLTLGDFAALPAPYNYVAMIPQWDFLDFLASAARKEPSFRIRMNTEVTGLLRDGDRIAGVSWAANDGTSGELTSDLVVAADGRSSIVRQAAGLVPKEFAVPFDTWWFRLPRHESEQSEIASLLPAIKNGEIMLTLTRETFFQVAYFAPKGSDARLRAEGVERFRERVASLRPDFADRVDAIRTMDDVHMLDVKLNRLHTWHRDGLLCIGDAAHAMSPAGGVGINLAIQDAVAAATRLAGPLLAGSLSPRVLASVRHRRARPTILLQFLQRRLHRVVFVSVFTGKRSGVPPLLIFLARHFPSLRTIPARLIAFGPLPEHAPEFARRPQAVPPDRPQPRSGHAGAAQ